MRRPALAALSLGLLLALWPGPAAATSPTLLQRLDAGRDGIAEALTGPIAACLARRDSDHPAFHGCIDWHSSVHAAWALLAYERATGDRRHAALVDATLAPQRLALERAELARRPRFEMPYGRAWFLRLALEHGRTRSSQALVAFADEVAAGLLAWLEAVGPDPWARDYRNQSWALVNLLDYAAYRGDPALAARARAFARNGFLALDRPCDPERQRGGFMATCLVLAMVATRVLGPSEIGGWLWQALPGLDRVRPIRDPRGAHEHGLNFSRAWGLWEVRESVGFDRAGQIYAMHFRQAYDDREGWDGDYRRVGHWVAQFGMFALQPLFAPEAGR